MPSSHPTRRPPSPGGVVVPGALAVDVARLLLAGLRLHIEQGRPTPPGLVDLVAELVRAAAGGVPGPEPVRAPSGTVITASELAARLGCSTGLIRRWCRTGRIPGARRTRGGWLIPEDAQEGDDRGQPAAPRAA
ncbi:helix-turn-helix domain-containing protein [Streptomyces sp. UG1]|uniref:helix-turn-helix domain-containing protein n=1 Tax=Streptomyces sp. UG1 TaxID=3417652 RepID=UPI003CF0B947